MAKRKGQLKLGLRAARTWGGARAGAGRKPKGARSGVAHVARPALSGREPVHVTWKLARGVPSLRGGRTRDVVRAAIERAREGERFRVVEWSAQGDHVHLVVERESARELARGMRSLAMRLVAGRRRPVGLVGPLVADRFHAHVLGTLREAVHAVRYVRENTRRHAARWSSPWTPSEAWRDLVFSAAPSWRAAPRTWLLRTARVRVSTA